MLFLIAPAALLMLLFQVLPIAIGAMKAGSAGGLESCAWAAAPGPAASMMDASAT